MGISDAGRIFLWLRPRHSGSRQPWVGGEAVGGTLSLADVHTVAGFDLGALWAPTSELPPSAQPCPASRPPAGVFHSPSLSPALCTKQFLGGSPFEAAVPASVCRAEGDSSPKQGPERQPFPFSP